MRRVTLGSVRRGPGSDCSDLSDCGCARRMWRRTARSSSRGQGTRQRVAVCRSIAQSMGIPERGEDEVFLALRHLWTTCAMRCSIPETRKNAWADPIPVLVSTHSQRNGSYATALFNGPEL